MIFDDNIWQRRVAKKANMHHAPPRCHENQSLQVSTNFDIFIFFTKHVQIGCRSREKHKNEAQDLW
jgi:hypothetical protein